MSGLNDGIDEEFGFEDEKQSTSSNVLNVKVTDKPVPEEETPSVTDLFGENIEAGKVPSIVIKPEFSNDINNNISDANDVFNSIKGFGAISRSNITAFESIMPGTIGSSNPVEFYSETPTKTMFDKSIVLMDTQINTVTDSQVSSLKNSLEYLKTEIEKTKSWIGHININRDEIKTNYVDNIFDLIKNNSDSKTRIIPGFNKTIEGVINSTVYYVDQTSEIAYSGNPKIKASIDKLSDTYKDRWLQYVLYCFGQDIPVTKDKLLLPTPFVIGEENPHPTMKKILEFTGSVSERELFNTLLEMVETCSLVIEDKIKLLENNSLEKTQLLEQSSNAVEKVKNTLTRVNTISVKLIQFEFYNIEFVKGLLNILYGAVKPSA
jgi:hypothetical protein